MNTKFQEKLAQLILDEISERLKNREYLREVLIEFVEFPPEKVAEEFLKEFEKLLTGDLKKQILKSLKEVFVKEVYDKQEKTIFEETQTKDSPINLEVQKEEIIEPVNTLEPVETEISTEQLPQPQIEIIQEPIIPTIEVEETKEKPSIFFRKEKKTDIVISENEWLYLYGFCYAPNSEGKGFPSIELPIKGVDDKNVVFGLDYGDVRLYLSKLNFEKFVIAKTGEHILNPKEAIPLKLNHSTILNKIRVNEIIVPLEFWTIKMGRNKIVSTVEERYLDFLHSLIDIHDAIDWDIEVSVLDNELMKILSGNEPTRTYESRIESRHPKVQKMEVKQFEKVLFKEKEIAQKVNLTLTKVANKIKVDYIISLDSSFLEGWKPILSARYVVGKEKRKAFYQSILDLQTEFTPYKVMINVNSPKVHFKF